MSYPSVSYLPAGYTREKPYPLILSLHGAGEAGKDGEKQTKVRIGVQLRRRPELYPAIVVMPQSPGQWRGRYADFALRALSQATEQFNVDPARQYITGIRV